MCVKLKSKYLKASERKRALEERKEKEEKKEGNASDVLSSFKERKKNLENQSLELRASILKQMCLLPSLAKDKSVVRSKTQSPPLGFICLQKTQTFQWAFTPMTMKRQVPL